MKKSLLGKTLLVAAVLSVTGCFFGGSTDDNALTKITPGFYVADYSGVTNGQFNFETELSIVQDGTFRMFWLADNAPILDRAGKWGQGAYYGRNSLHFFEGQNLWVGQTDSLIPAPDDTDQIRDITPTSFVRLQWTPYLEKPLWITYTLKNYPVIKDGDYVFSEAGDSTRLPTLIKLSFKGSDFTYSYSDTSEKYQATAKWFQIGTILATVQNKQKYFSDSLKAFPETWDSTSLSPEILQRVSAISDKSFQMFNPPPPGIPDTGSWTVYTRQ
jgi:hypothetical protein